MADAPSYCVVITTTATREDAEVIARHLLAERLAACVQVSAIESFYIWKEEIARDHEFLLYIKTRTDLFERVEQAIRSRHKYEVPEIIQLPIVAAAASYLKWIDEATEQSPEEGITDAKIQ